MVARSPIEAITVFQVGHMIQAESDAQKREEFLQRLMSLPNQVCFQVASCIPLYFKTVPP